MLNNLQTYKKEEVVTQEIETMLYLICEHAFFTDREVPGSISISGNGLESLYKTFNKIELNKYVK